MIEVWKSINGFDGYSVSNLGRVRSDSRTIVRVNGTLQTVKSRVLRLATDRKGYNRICLTIKCVKNTKKVHHLVWDAFGLEERVNGIQVDHINGVKSDNRIENLQLMTNRQNTSKHHYANKNKSSDYTGVRLDKRTGKFIASIYAERKARHIGVFECEQDASNAYQNALIQYGR